VQAYKKEQGIMATKHQASDDAEAAEQADAPVSSTPEPGAAAKGKEAHARRWYAVHTYSGYENKVKLQMEARAQTMHVADKIFQILVPIEEVTEIRNGERRTVKRKVFPSYVLVDMVLDDESWHCVKGTPGVTNFVGGANNMDPIPLEEHEIDKILKQVKQTSEGGEKAPAVMPKFKVGESVHIIEGPFADFIGQVSEIHPERTKLTVLVSFFNRETPVELDYLQVEKV
jgi:transcription termination/antitermination protein NusG